LTHSVPLAADHPDEMLGQHNALTGPEPALQANAQGDRRHEPSNRIKKVEVQSIQCKGATSLIKLSSISPAAPIITIISERPLKKQANTTLNRHSRESGNPETLDEHGFPPSRE